jgi:hypothetical protein
MTISRTRKSNYPTTGVVTKLNSGSYNLVRLADVVGIEVDAIGISLPGGLGFGR